MATKVNVNGKLVTRPGVYTLIKSGIQNNPVRLDYGVVCIVDDGISAGWGAGKDQEAYSFETVQSFRDFVKGGPLWDLAAPLWKPVPNKSIQGVSKVILIQARETAPATITYAFTNGDVVLTTKDEGLNANGSEVSSELKKGYAATFAAEGVDTYRMKLWHGSYKGLDALNNVPYEGVTEANAAPILIAQSPLVANLQELKDWLDTDVDVQTGFTPVVTIDSGVGDLVAGDASANTGNKLATGATETYSAGALTAAMSKAKEANCSFFLSMKFNADADHANNDTLLSDVILQGKYERQLFIGGGYTAAELDTVSIPAAEHFDSDKVVIVHGDGKNTTNSGFKLRTSLWKTANILGRLCGLEPQTPLTLKSTGLDAENNPLSEDQQEEALAAGVLCTYTDDELGYNVVLQGINTLQENDNLVNEDGSSFSIAVKRITAQLNKEVAVYLKRKFFGKDTVGPNRNTVTESDLVAATEGYLQKRTASSNQDDLIVRFQNISAVVNADTYNVNYEFVPNFEINKFIVTGIILDK